MSWLFSQALVAEYSDRISWDGEQCAQLNVKPTQHKFWRNDKMMEFSRLSQFGLTCSLLTENHGEELLTLYLADFHARTLAQQEKAQVSTVLDQACGPKWLELLVKYDLDSSSWKTHQCLFPEDLPESSVILPKWGMTRNGHVFQHPISERPISATDFGLLPTPRATDSTRRDCRSERNRKSPNLESTVKMWATPKALDGNKRGQVSSDPRNGLAGQVKNYPTPQASDCRDRGNLGSPVIQRRIQKGKQIGLSMSVSDTSGALNPSWVEWLMGWPIGWTDLKPLEMDKFQSWQRMHLNHWEHENDSKST
jgi:hypothetical protein